MNPMNEMVTNEPLINMNVPRLEKGIQLMEEVTIMNDTMAIVRSQSNPKKFYEVNYKFLDCSCPDNQFRSVKCKHIQSVLLKLGGTQK